MKRTLAAALALATVLALGFISPAVAGPNGKPPKGMTAAEKDTSFNSFLDQLVAKGTITVGQAEAISTAMKGKRSERQAKLEAFAQKADAAVAAMLGLSREKFCELRAARALPMMTPEQRNLMRIKLNEIAVALGLPKAPKGK